MRVLSLRLVALMLALALAPASALGQSSPNWPLGYIPSAPEWNGWFARKQDYNPNINCTFSPCAIGIPTNPNSVLSTGSNGVPNFSPLLPSGIGLPSPQFSGTMAGGALDGYFSIDTTGNIAGQVTPSGASGSLSLGAAVAAPGVPAAADGVLCDTITDDAAAINSGLASATGGILRLPANATCVIKSTLTVPTNTWLVCPTPGTTIEWEGSSGGIMIETSPTVITLNAGVIGCTINPNGLAGTVFRLDSGAGDTIENINIPDAMATGGIVLDLHADIGSAPSGNLIALNVHDIYVSGQAGTCVALTGSGGGTPTTVVTDNNFYNIACTDITAYGLNFVQDADTNRFYGFYAQLDSNNAVGYAFGSGNFTAVEGVYENAIYGSAIDAFSGFTGRVGAKFGYSPNNTLADFVQSPIAEGGVFTYAVAGVPEYIRYINAGSGSPDSYMRIYEGNSSVITAPITGVGNCTNLGSTGTCSLYTSSTSSSGIIILSPSGTGEGTNGVAELTFPVAAQGYSCTVSLAEGTDSWATGASVAYSGIDSTHINIVWNNNATALASSGTYFLSYYCRMNSTGWQ